MTSHDLLQQMHFTTLEDHVANVLTSLKKLALKQGKACPASDWCQRAASVNLSFEHAQREPACASAEGSARC